MRSRGNRLRLERALRIAGMLAVALWIVAAARSRARRSETVRVDSLTEALPRWTQRAVDSIHVLIDTVPNAVNADWLAALRGTGAGVSWSASGIQPLAIETFPAADPAGGVFVLVGASGGTTRVLSDALGPIDTLPDAPGPLVARLAAVEGDIALTAGAQPARASAARAASPRRVFVSGAAGWEAKFVVAALEEEGWLVDARMFVSPAHEVWSGGAIGRSMLDTARYAAVVLLDSAAAEAARGLEPFARAGGGIVFAGDATRATRAAGIAAWRTGRRETAPLGTLPGDSAWRGLARAPLEPLAGRRSIALESRDGRPVVAVRRHYAGRVAAVGFDQTWRWRMAGEGNSSVAHGEWWSRLVGSVAARRPDAGSGSAARGAAPLAWFHDVLGAPSALVPARPASVSPQFLSHLLGAIALIALLLEWLLRRARGER
jgi:hypothetical protein